MLKSIAAGAALGAALLAASLPGGPAVGAPGERTPVAFAATPPYVDQVLKETKAPSLAVAVSRNGKVLWEQGFGWADPQARIPATPHTIYGLASVTKSITSTELMVLRQRGAIDLDQPLNRYLGAAKLSSPAWDANQATVRRVATHTAGLTSFDAVCYADEPDCDRSRDDMLSRHGVIFWRPGSRFDYSNLGYGALGQAIAHVTGRPYAEAVRRDVFAPLGMTECAADRTARVAPHYEDGARAPAQEALAQGASSLACSADALLRFGMYQLGDAVAGARPILSPAALKAMHDETVATDDSLRYGIGWWVNPDQHGYRVVFASGGTADSGALLYTFPTEDIAIVVLGNAGDPRLSDVADRIAGALLPRYAADLARGAAAPPPAAPPPTAPPPADPRLAAFAGVWRGAISTWKGVVPVVFEVAPSGETKASIAGAPFKAERRARLYGDGGLLLGAHGDIGTPETGRRRPYRMGFELYPDAAGDLRGAATTWQDPGARNGGVFSYWVSLKRATAAGPPPSGPR